MGSNETLVVSEPVADVIDNQSTAVPTEEAGYTYERADGTVELAMSAEDAIARCPVLGKLAIEAPEQANVLLELASAGKAKMQANLADELAKPKPDKQTKIKPEKIDHPKYNDKTLQPKLTEQNALKQERFVPAKLEEAVVAKPALVEQKETMPILNRQIELSRQAAELDDAIKRSKDIVLALSTTSEINDAEPVPVKASQDIAERELQVEQTVPMPPRPTTSTVIVKPEQTTKTVTMPALESTVTANYTETQTTLPERDGQIEEVAIVAQIDEVHLGMSDIEVTRAGAETEHANTLTTNVVPVGTDPILAYDTNVLRTELSPEAETTDNEWLELLYEPETIEAYNLLVQSKDEAIDISAEPVAWSAVEDSPVDTHDAQSLVIGPELDFETYIKSKPATEEPMTIELIQECAEQQPLEQTLVQLVEYLNEANDKPELSVVSKIMQEIKTELPACRNIDEAEHVSTKITPELTDKLLKLLRILGYENPTQTLVGFVAQYDLASLLQALEYIGQLQNAHGRHESISASLTTNLNDDDTTRLRLEAVIALIMKTVFDPKTLAT